jgi:hypothetical protein
LRIDFRLQPDGRAYWIEAPEDIEAATARAYVLEKYYPRQYVIHRSSDGMWLLPRTGSGFESSCRLNPAGSLICGQGATRLLTEVLKSFYKARRSDPVLPSEIATVNVYDPSCVGVPEIVPFPPIVLKIMPGGNEPVDALHW